jgi:hypothetical protein
LILDGNDAFRPLFLGYQVTGKFTNRYFDVGFKLKLESQRFTQDPNIGTQPLG